MTKEFNFRGFVILLILIALVCGGDMAWNIVEGVVSGVREFLICLPMLIKPFIPFLGIEELSISLLIFGVVLMIASGLGIFVSHKCRSKVWMVISGSVAIVSSIITLVFAVKI